jgi:hypothetical protein
MMIFILTVSTGGGGANKKNQKNRLIDTCVIRTHAPEGIALAGQRVNHSAKVP